MTCKNRVLALVVALSAVGCVGAVESEDEVASFRADLSRRGVSRVVIARMFQRENWTLPAADTYRASELPRVADRRIAYVCDAIAPLRPTYVSGLVRLEHDQEITDRQAEIFAGVKACIRGRTGHRVRFDVVLNALHYTDSGEGISSRREGAERLYARLRSANDRLDPDGYFFDFYSTPWTDPTRRFHRDALLDGIRRIHGSGRFVGGNVWRGVVPAGSDFVSTNDRGGKDNVAHNMELLRDRGVPVLMHIRNDPHIDGTEGRLWNERGRAYRKRILRRHVRWQELGYNYMFPVFFPLRPGRISYDAAADGNMLDRIGAYMDAGTDRARLAVLAAEDGAPTPYDSDDDGMVSVHRAYHGGAQQHLYSTSLLELDQADGLATEMEDFFSLARTAAPGTTPLYRCYLGSGWHLLTGDAACEGAPSATNEGALGHLATAPVPGTVPLHRLFRAEGPDHFYTTSAPERDLAVRYGYAYEGVVGHVWDEWGYAVPESERIAIHRAYHPRNRQHLFSTSLAEITGAAGLTLEAEGAFHLSRSADTGTAPLHRCYLGRGWHLLTTHASCEHAPGAVDEGVMGHLATTPLPGTIPLYRLFHAGALDHFYTTSAAERDYAVTLGYVAEGVSGHVYVAP